VHAARSGANHRCDGCAYLIGGALAAAPSVAAEPREPRSLFDTVTRREWMPAALDEPATLAAETRVIRVTEVGERLREHGAALERRGARAQEDDPAPAEPTKAAVARVSAAKRLASHLDSERFSRSRELG
jgi:hypothetical protein